MALGHLFRFISLLFSLLVPGEKFILVVHTGRVPVGIASKAILMLFFEKDLPSPKPEIVFVANNRGSIPSNFQNPFGLCLVVVTPSPFVPAEAGLKEKFLSLYPVIQNTASLHNLVPQVPFLLSSLIFSPLLLPCTHHNFSIASFSNSSP